MFKKISLLLALFISALLFLSACSSFTVEEAKTIPNSVVEVRKNGVFEKSTYGYYNSQGEIEEFQACESKLFEKTSCTTEDGVRTFKYSTRKGGTLTRVELHVDGLKIDLRCTRAALGAMRVCVPK